MCDESKLYAHDQRFLKFFLVNGKKSLEKEFKIVV